MSELNSELDNELGNELVNEVNRKVSNGWLITKEAELTQETLNTIDEFWVSKVHTDSFNGESNVPIAYAYAIPDNAHTGVLLINGRVESLLKYKEAIYDLFNNGFAVFTLDHRGQGLSGRMTNDSEQGFVESFDHYVNDVSAFINLCIKPNWTGSLTLLCHSMGGAVGALTMLKHPQLFSRAVLCSPMFGIKPALPAWLVKTILSAGLYKAKCKSKPVDYFFGQKGYVAYPFALNVLTHSKNRYQSMLTLYAKHQNLRLGGVTTQWLMAAYQAIQTIEEQAHEIKTSTLVISSSKDRIIDNKRQARVASKFKNIEYKVVDGAFHELLCESDEHRELTMQNAMQFLSSKP